MRRNHHESQGLDLDQVARVLDVEICHLFRYDAPLMQQMRVSDGKESVLSHENHRRFRCLTAKATPSAKEQIPTGDRVGVAHDRLLTDSNQPELTLGFAASYKGSGGWFHHHKLVNGST